jgi:hypothetical protein
MEINGLEALSEASELGALGILSYIGYQLKRQREDLSKVMLHVMQLARRVKRLEDIRYGRKIKRRK